MEWWIPSAFLNLPCCSSVSFPLGCPSSGHEQLLPARLLLQSSLGIDPQFQILWIFLERACWRPLGRQRWNALLHGWACHFLCEPLVSVPSASPAWGLGRSWAAILSASAFSLPHLHQPSTITLQWRESWEDILQVPWPSVTGVSVSAIITVMNCFPATITNSRAGGRSWGSPGVPTVLTSCWRFKAQGPQHGTIRFDFSVRNKGDM